MVRNGLCGIFILPSRKKNDGLENGYSCFPASAKWSKCLPLTNGRADSVLWSTVSLFSNLVILLCTCLPISFLTSALCFFLFTRITLKNSVFHSLTLIKKIARTCLGDHQESKMTWSHQKIILIWPQLFSIETSQCLLALNYGPMEVLLG